MKVMRVDAAIECGMTSQETAQPNPATDERRTSVSALCKLPHASLAVEHCAGGSIPRNGEHIAKRTSCAA
jgi:hypothetical protein